MSYRSSMLSLKTAVASAGVLAAAVALGLAAPFLSAEVPRAYGALRAWLTPPYLYFVVNGIIISIAASSRFHKAAADGPDPAGSVLPVAGPTVVPSEFVAPAEYAAKVEEEEELRPELVVSAAEYEAKAEEDEARPAFVAPAVYGAAEAAAEEEFVISRSSWSPKRREIPPEYSAVAPEKPLVSVRFGQQRRSAKASPDGKALGVARPKRGEALESTWKAITDGRAVPLVRHLKKSDTWGDAHGRGCQEAAAPLMRKSETFNERVRRPAAGTSPSTSSGGSSGGRVRREPSLGQDDLNRRVEAFIKKFNEEMRLQRQESFQHYLDMINRSSH